MKQTRRNAVLSLLIAGAVSAPGQDRPEQPGLPRLHTPGEDENRRMPDGKSQNDAIAKQQHEDALKDAGRLVTLAKEIQDEIEKAGNYVVPIATVKKTEEAEKLARKIRSRLKS
jgi:hypothetical protein